MDIGNFSPFYRTLSSFGAAAHKGVEIRNGGGLGKVFVVAGSRVIVGATNSFGTHTLEDVSMNRDQICKNHGQELRLQQMNEVAGQGLA